MRQITRLLQEVAIASNPSKEKIYSQLYPLLDTNIGTGGSLDHTKFQEAMTTADFPLALGEFINRALWPAYTRQAFDFAPIVFNDTVPNFLGVTRYQRQSGLDDLEIVRPKGRIRAGRIEDAFKREYRVYRWSKGYDFSYEAIVNDDLGYFNDMAALMGDSARRSIEKFVSRLYNNATTIAALQALGVLFAGTARLSTNALMTAWGFFNQRTDARGEPIAVAPVNLVIHRALEPVARQIMASQQVAENATNAVNVLPNFNIIIDPYLTGTSPDLPWWLFSNANQDGIRPLTLARLQGRDTPLVLQKAPDTMLFAGFGRAGGMVNTIGDFETGNIALKVEDVWGGWDDSTFAGLTDQRGAFYSSGTTP